MSVFSNHKFCTECDECYRKELKQCPCITKRQERLLLLKLEEAARKMKDWASIQGHPVAEIQEILETLDQLRSDKYE